MFFFFLFLIDKFNWPHFFTDLGIKMVENQFYRGLKPLLIYAKLLGMLPVTLKTNGPTFSFCSCSVVYTILYFLFIVGFTVVNSYWLNPGT